MALADSQSVSQSESVNRRREGEIEKDNIACPKEIIYDPVGCAEVVVILMMIA